MFGNVGGGKTHLAVGLLREIARYNRKAIYVDMADLSGELHAEYAGEEGEYSGDIIGDLQRYPIALLDDLGVERRTPDIFARVAEVIRRRYNERRTLITLITSNLDWPAEFAKRYGEQTVSRLNECCRAIACPEIDWRLGGAK